MEIRSSGFGNGERIPDRFAKEGEDRSPRLVVEHVPEEARTLALVVDDPDAPAKTWVHWLIWGIPADSTEIPEGVPREQIVEGLGGARQGKNDFDEIGYGGPQPPKGHGPHRYRFTAYALREHIDLDAGATREALERAMEGAVLDRATTTGTYERR